MVAVGGVCKPDGAVVRVDDDVVDRVEETAVEGGDERLGLVWRIWVRYVHQAAGRGLASLGAVEQAIFVVYSPIPHPF